MKQWILCSDSDPIPKVSHFVSVNIPNSRHSSSRHFKQMTLNLFSHTMWLMNHTWLFEMTETHSSFALEVSHLSQKHWDKSQGNSIFNARGNLFFTPSTVGDCWYSGLCLTLHCFSLHVTSVYTARGYRLFHLPLPLSSQDSCSYVHTLISRLALVCFGFGSLDCM